jgi:hypothetical protein
MGMQSNTHSQTQESTDAADTTLSLNTNNKKSQTPSPAASLESAHAATHTRACTDIRKHGTPQRHFHKTYLDLHLNFMFLNPFDLLCDLAMDGGLVGGFFPVLTLG